MDLKFSSQMRPFAICWGYLDSGTNDQWVFSMKFENIVLLMINGIVCPVSGWLMDTGMK